MPIFERMDSLFEEVEQKTGMSKHRILLDSGLDPAQYRAYKRAGRLPSAKMLIRLGNSPNLPVSLERLMAWKAIDEFGPAILREAFKVLQEE